MTEYGVALDEQRVRVLFTELSERLAARGVQAQVFVVGGAAMALQYDPGRLTRDVDAVFIPSSEVRQIAEEMSAAHGLEPDWLNDAAKGFLPGDDAHPVTVFESESLLVQVPSAAYLLAMKLHASRDERDLDDAARLFDRLGYATAQECIDLLGNTYPVGQLLPRHRYIAEDVASRARLLRPRQADPPSSTTESSAIQSAPGSVQGRSQARRPPVPDVHRRRGDRPPGRSGPSL